MAVWHCELCSLDESKKFKYASQTLFEEHLRLVHGIELGADGRSIKDSTHEKPEKPENPIVQQPPRR